MRGDWNIIASILEKFHKVTPSVFLVLFYLLAFVFLSFAVKEIPLTIVYATWCGAGIFSYQ